MRRAGFARDGFDERVEAGQIVVQFGKGIAIETEFSDDVLRNIRRNAVHAAGLTFGRFKKLVKFFRVKF